VPGEVAAPIVPSSAPEVVEPASLTKTGALIGTPRYMAPEIFAGQAATTRSDVYSLGALLFELLVGKPPFGEPDLVRLSVAVQLREAPPLRPLLPDGELADGFAAVVDRCLARDPQRRYADGAELVAALSAISSPTRAVLPAASHRSARWIVIGLAALFAAALALRPLLSSVPQPEISSGRPPAMPLPGLSMGVDLGVPADLRASPDLSPVREPLPPVEGAVIRPSEAPKAGARSAVRRLPVTNGKRPVVSPSATPSPSGMEAKPQNSAPAPPVVAPAKPAASDAVEIPIER
jgi:serine/threonine protein kinase